MGAQPLEEYREWKHRYLGANRGERIIAAIEGDRFPLSKSSRGLANSLVIATGGGVLFGFSGFSSRASVQYIQVFDAITVPADGAAPDVVLGVPANTNFSADWGDIGRNFYTGIVICNSTTIGTKTIGAADTFFDVQYV